MYIYFCLGWVSVAEQAFLYLQCGTFSRAVSVVAERGLQAGLHVGWGVGAQGLSCSKACGFFPDQGSNPCLLHRQADSLICSHHPEKASTGREWFLRSLGADPLLCTDVPSGQVPSSVRGACDHSTLQGENPDRVEAKVEGTQLSGIGPSLGIFLFPKKVTSDLLSEDLSRLVS